MHAVGEGTVHAPNLLVLQVLLSLRKQQETNFGVIGILGSDVDILYVLQKEEMLLPRGGGGDFHFTVKCRICLSKVASAEINSFFFPFFPNVICYHVVGFDIINTSISPFPPWHWILI